METNLKCAASHECNSTAEQFWYAIDIYNKRPHIMNRKLIGAEILLSFRLSDNSLVKSICSRLKRLEKTSVGDVLQSVQNVEGLSVLNSVNCEHCDFVHFTLRNLLPRSNVNFMPQLELTVLDNVNSQARFIGFTSGNEQALSPDFEYGFAYTEKSVMLMVDANCDDSNKYYRWLHYFVLPKLVKWITNAGSQQTSLVKASLSCVPIEKYVVLYNRLKSTYGDSIIKIWPENTDPYKFVYEDIAIASYLMLLWDNTVQKFVDIGCGNGLLVHILNSEGHQGIGYDLKARKIWSLYPDSTKLKVLPVLPSEKTLFPEADWLIGNHSDELTLWIPVFAACSSYRCKFFVLPCCPYDFSGKKYQRVNTKLSQYMDYLNYVQKICEKCGFKTEVDKLRIPSTKRTCFIGKDRVYPESEMDNYNLLIKKYIYTQSNSENNFSDNRYCDFKTRSEQKVRNCTQINRNLVEHIVKTIAEELLKTVNLEDGWNKGGILDISYCAQCLSPDNLHQLKKECGGLQTLLKNQHSVFKVDCGKVQLRKPIVKKKGNSAWKQRQCWFFYNHPDSCPLADVDCSFIH